MEWLNYHHLLYFYTVAKEGSIARASQTLRLAQPTISGQLRALEESLGERLFDRRGRGLVLTEVGNLVFRYAEEIFTLGRELQDTLKGRPAQGRPVRLRVGVADVVPKLISYRLLEPALSMTEPVQLACREDRMEVLMSDLARHGLDLVVAEAATTPDVSVRVFNHLLGETGTSVCAVPALAAKYQVDFPRSMDGAPFLMPGPSTVARRTFDHWLEMRSLRPSIVAELDDTALLTVFGSFGRGLFLVATAIEKEVCEQYGVALVGRLPDVRQRFFAISVERRIKNPAIKAITESARKDLFAGT